MAPDVPAFAVVGYAKSERALNIVADGAVDKATVDADRAGTVTVVAGLAVSVGAVVAAAADVVDDFAAIVATNDAAVCIAASEVAAAEVGTGTLQRQRYYQLKSWLALQLTVPGTIQTDCGTLYSIARSKCLVHLIHLRAAPLMLNRNAAAIADVATECCSSPVRWYHQ